MGWFEPEYRPSAGERYRERRADAKESRADARRDRTEAQRVVDQIRADRERADREAAKAAQDAANAVRAEAAADEKRILSTPETRYTGATSKVRSPIYVWHWKAEPPQKIRNVLGVDHRAGYGPIIALGAGGGIRRSDLVVDAVTSSKPALVNDMDAGAIWAGTVRGVTEQVLADYPILGVLRNDELMAELLGNAGVNTESTKPEDVHGYYGVYTRKVTLVTVPTLTDVSIERDGLALTFAPMPGVTSSDWTKKLDKLVAGFAQHGLNAPQMSTVPTSDGGVQLRFRDRDPLSEPLPQVVPEYDADRGRVPLGMAADGSPVYLTLKNNPQALIAGITRGGKTASLMTATAALAGHVELHVIDSLGSGEWELFRDVCATYDDSGDPAVLTQLMRDVIEAMRPRMAKIKELGDINFWDIPRERREAAGMYPVVIVNEEAHMALREKQATDARTEAAKTTRALLGINAATIGKMGVILWNATQKPIDKFFPADVRDMATQRVSFRLDSAVAAAAVLGDAAYLEPNPQTSIRAGQQGRFVASVDERGNVLGQAFYAPVAVISDHLRDAKHVPAQLRAAKSAPEPTPSTEPTDTAPTEGDDW